MTCPLLGLDTSLASHSLSSCYPPRGAILAHQTVLYPTIIRNPSTLLSILGCDINQHGRRGGKGAPGEDCRRKEARASVPEPPPYSTNLPVSFRLSNAKRRRKRRLQRLPKINQSPKILMHPLPKLSKTPQNRPRKRRTQPLSRKMMQSRTVILALLNPPLLLSNQRLVLRHSAPRRYPASQLRQGH